MGNPSRIFRSTFNLGLSLMFGVWLVLGYLGLHPGPRRTPAFAARALFPTPAPSNIITEDDLRFGEQQVTRMLRDRPQMAQCTTLHDPMYDWAVRQFAGGAMGQRAYWYSSDPTTLVDGINAESGILTKGYPGIRIRRLSKVGPSVGQPLSGDEYWSCLVFESFNLGQTPAFEKVYGNALSGDVGRSQYILDVARVECVTCQKTRQFYHDVWGPYMQAKGLPTDPEVWKEYDSPDFNTWIANYTDPTGYPYMDYGHYFDESIAPYLRQNGITPKP